MNHLRIVSFLPAATEMAYALGLGDQVVGVSHECDFPAHAKTKPVVVRCALPVETMSLNEIDVAVAECIGSGGNLYEVDQPTVEQFAGLGGSGKVRFPAFFAESAISPPK